MNEQVEKREIVLVFEFKGEREAHIITFWKNGMVRGDKRIKK